MVGGDWGFPACRKRRRVSPRARSTRKPSVVPRDQPGRRCRVEKRKRVSDDSDSDEDEHELLFASVDNQGNTGCEHVGDQNDRENSNASGSDSGERSNSSSSGGVSDQSSDGGSGSESDDESASSDID